METTQKTSNRLRLSILADQLTSSVGGGRFLRGFLSALLFDPNMQELFDHVYLLVTQGESIECLGDLPPRVSVIYRRFPNRLRHTVFNRLVKYTLPAVDVAYGPFYYSFPSLARGRVVTLHDLSIFNQQFHPSIHARKQSALVTRMVHECDGVVCISNDVLCEFKSRWPHLAHKATMIYNGVSAMGIQPLNAKAVPEHSILAVGTIEPRKNYPILIDAFERLVHELGDSAPMLTVVGKMGWMSESVEQRLLALQAAGRCRWLQNASDEELNDAYGKAGVFSFLSLSEGFGYPPFEAAFARCPMVLSNASSVGEIWAGHAKCVDPHDVEEIVAAWKWALELTPPQREAVAATQERRAREFTWSRAIHEYIAFWNRLLNKDCAAAERFSATRGWKNHPVRRTAQALTFRSLL